MADETKKKAAPKARVAPPSKSGPAAVRTTEALKHGEGAFGARFLKPGFAFTPEMDLAFALGYPDLTYLVDDATVDATVATRKEFVENHATNARNVWPRGVAYRVVRAFDQVIYDGPMTAAMATPPTPVEPDEASGLIRRFLTNGRAGDLLLLLESMVGPDLVVEVALGELESRAEEIIAEDKATYGRTIYNLGFVVLRLPAAAGVAAQARLEALYRAFSSRKWPEDDVPSPIRFLDVVLHGVEGSLRSGHRAENRLSPAFFGHVTDSPEHVAKYTCENLPRWRLEPDARRAFLGGEATLQCEAKAWKNDKRAGAHGRLVESFGAIQSPLIAPMMLEMAVSSKAKPAALAWFHDHASFAKDFLKLAAKGDGKPAELAKSLLS
jgi:hypothetical protein